jgi:hypothetical protein
MKKFSNKLFIGTFLGLLISNQAQSVNPEKKDSKPVIQSSANCKNITLKNSTTSFTICIEPGEKIPSPSPTLINAVNKSLKELIRQFSIKERSNKEKRSNQKVNKQNSPTKTSDSNKISKPNDNSKNNKQGYGEDDFDFEDFDIGGDTVDIETEEDPSFFDGGNPDPSTPDFSSPDFSSPSDPSVPSSTSSVVPMNPNTAPVNSGTTNPQIYPLNLF